ncbi:hypothetical protein B0H13DRAFT_1886840 [Mycena leptocephala]|nr:hypothetical protein B0H13DRAFT_1886840 [Mycena leptocephala]
MWTVANFRQLPPVGVRLTDLQTTIQSRLYLHPVGTLIQNATTTRGPSGSTKTMAWWGCRRRWRRKHAHGGRAFVLNTDVSDTHSNSYRSTHPSSMRNAGHMGSLGASSRAASPDDANADRARASPLRIVRLSSPDSTRPSKGLDTRRLPALLAGPLIHTSIRWRGRSKGWYSSAHALVYRCIRAPSIVHCAPPRLSRPWRASLSAKACVAAPQVCLPHTLAQTRANSRRAGSTHLKRLSKTHARERAEAERGTLLSRLNARASSSWIAGFAYQALRAPLGGYRACPSELPMGRSRPVHSTPRSFLPGDTDSATLDRTGTHILPPLHGERA